MAAMARAPLVSLFLVLGACSGCTPSSDGAPSADDEPGADTPAIAEPSSGGAAAADAPVDPADPPVVSVAGRPAEGGVAIVVQSRGAAPARVRRAVRVEAREGDAWTPVETGESVLLRDRCDDDPPACVELVPGAELRAVPWSGRAGDAQCACERCAAVPAGEYRFVLESCAPEGHAPHRIASAPFPVGG